MLGSQLNAQLGTQAALAILGDLSSAVTAAGTAQSSAALLTAANNVVTSAAQGSGVRLPATPTVSACDRIYVANQTAVNFWVYPPSSGAIGGNAVNVGVMMAPKKAAEFFCLDGTSYTAILST